MIGPPPPSSAQMNTKPRKRYTPESNAQAAELIRAGKPVSQIAEELCIGSSLLYQRKLDSHPATRKLSPQTGE